ncbi:MAG: CehA/McbA family metallohydrolase [Armatimonadota bacterium]
MAHERFEMVQRPREFIAGQYVTVAFRYTVGENGLNRGSRLKIGLPSVGWGEPLVNHRRYWELEPDEPRKWLHYKRINTTFEIESNTGAYLDPSARQETRPGDTRCIQRWWMTFEVIAADFAPGDMITITYGDTTWGEAGARVQPVIEEKGDFSCFIHDPDGEVREVPGSPVWIEVVGGGPEKAFIGLPSVISDAEADLTPNVFVTDRCCNPPEGKAKDFNVRVTCDEVCRAEADTNELELSSNPGVIIPGAKEQVYWGDIHGKTGFSGDGLAPIDDYISYARDTGGADFTCVTDHSGCNRESWITTQEKAREYTTDGEFVALKGFEYSYNHGHRNVYFDNHEIEDIWPDERLDLDPQENGTRPFFEYLRTRKDELLSIPHHTLVWTDWDVYDQELEPICEIYSMWGCSERTVGEGNPLWDKSCIPGGGAQAALGRGYRMGFIAASDTHSGFPGRQHPDLYGFCFTYKAGLAAIRAEELTAKALVDALKARNCYGTTGARIYVEFFVDGHRMGSEIALSGDRKITGRVVGSDQVTRIDIVRNNEDYRTLRPESDDVTIDVTDSDQVTPGTFYYLRIWQADGEMAWTSPVWLD